jgi:hypothetical protein
MADRQVEAYRSHAGVCLWLAQRTGDPETKLILLDMARAWQTLAEQGEKNRNTTLVYETPEPRFHTAQQPPKPGRSDPEIRQ